MRRQTHSLSIVHTVRRVGAAVALATCVSVATAHANEKPIPIPNECPNSEAVSWVYTYDDHERALAEVDLEGESTTFGLLADFEGTSIIIRVKDAQSGKSIGVIKTGTANNSMAGEIYAYRFSRLLGFSGMVAPVIPVDLRDGALVKLRDVLRGKRYRDENKEWNRQKVVRQLDQAIRNDAVFHGAFKEWIPAFQFHAGLGKRENLGRQPITPYFRARAEQPEREDITLSQLTRLYSPRGTHRGTADLAQLAEDYSNMMLMDALMGQNDRYAGANVHFRSINDTREEAGERLGLPIFELGRVRLLALDNGASLHSRTGTALGDIQGQRVAATRIERFSKTAVTQLRLFAQRVLGEGCDRPASDEEIVSLFKFLGVTDEATRTKTINYIPPVLEYIDGLEARYGDAIYFAPVGDEEKEEAPKGAWGAP